MFLDTVKVPFCSKLATLKSLAPAAQDRERLKITAAGPPNMTNTIPRGCLSSPLILVSFIYTFGLPLHGPIIQININPSQMTSESISTLFKLASETEASQQTFLRTQELERHGPSLFSASQSSATATAQARRTCCQLTTCGCLH